MKRDFARLLTEQRHPGTRPLDRLPLLRLIDVIQHEEARVPRAVRSQRVALARGVRLLVDRMRRGGRMILAGAGTSGRLGVLEAAECPPTFDTPRELVRAIMAGGPGCVWASKEGAEDDAHDGARQVRNLRVKPADTVIGIAASGVTPFVMGALKEARRARAGRILVTCNRKGVDRRAAEVIIAPLVGPEIIAGSTRLKAGTATKLVLNTLTVATMVHLGKVYENLMVDLQPKSAKLVARAKRIIRTLGRVDEPTAARALKASGNRVKVAVAMLLKRVDRPAAEALLSQAGGILRKALES